MYDKPNAPPETYQSASVFFGSPIVVTQGYDLLYTRGQAYEFADDDREVRNFVKPEKGKVSGAEVEALIDLAGRVNNLLRGLHKLGEEKDAGEFAQAARKLAEPLLLELKPLHKSRLESAIQSTAELADNLKNGKEISSGIKIVESAMESIKAKCDKCKKICMAHHSLVLKCGHVLGEECLERYCWSEE